MGRYVAMLDKLLKRREIRSHPFSHRLPKYSHFAAATCFGSYYHAGWVDLPDPQAVF